MADISKGMHETRAERVRGIVRELFEARSRVAALGAELQSERESLKLPSLFMVDSLRVEFQNGPPAFIKIIDVPTL